MKTTTPAPVWRTVSLIVLQKKEGGKEGHGLACPNLSMAELRPLCLNIAELPLYNTAVTGISALNFSLLRNPMGIASSCQTAPSFPFSIQQPPFNYKMMAPDGLKNKI